MKIAYISNSTIPSKDANSIQVVKMCESFVRNGHKVTLYCYRDKLLEDQDINTYYGITLRPDIVKISTGGILCGKLICGLFMALHAKYRKHDLVYGRFLPGCYFSAILGVPTIYEMHKSYEDKKSLGFRVLSRLCKVTNLKKIVVISQALKEWLLNDFGALNCDIDVAPDGATLYPSHMRNVISLPGQGSFHVGYIGHLYPGKGAEIIAKLAASCPWADFQVVGGTIDQIARCRELFGQLSNIHLHGFVPPADTQRFRDSCDALIAPYMSTVLASGGADIGRWMSPLKIFEYMASAKPIVATDLPVLREVLTHNVNALLCGEQAIEDWVGALVALRDNPELCARLAKAAHDDFLANYTWDQRAEHVLRGLPV